jgi:hypothetical protein
LMGFGLDWLVGTFEPRPTKASPCPKDTTFLEIRHARVREVNPRPKVDYASRGVRMNPRLRGFARTTRRALKRSDPSGQRPARSRARL